MLLYLYPICIYLHTSLGPAFPGRATLTQPHESNSNTRAVLNDVYLFVNPCAWMIVRERCHRLIETSLREQPFESCSGSSWIDVCERLFGNARNIVLNMSVNDVGEICSWPARGQFVNTAVVCERCSQTVCERCSWATLVNSLWTLSVKVFVLFMNVCSWTCPWTVHEHMFLNIVRNSPRF